MFAKKAGKSNEEKAGGKLEGPTNPQTAAFKHFC